MESSVYLFVYSSLLSGFKSPAYEYISKYFTLLGPATVKGTLYDLGTYPVAVGKDTGRWLKGELYQLNNPSEFSYVMAQLDDYEGLHPDENEEVLYKRALAEVTLLDRTSRQAWIYWYKHDVADRPVIESGDLLDYLANHN